ncbi:MAG: DNA mismatch repair endonuclease MutL [Eubacterium sp.]|nr:DNA mismatch repair endonuclease MutL [Eubacterium sp.]
MPTIRLLDKSVAELIAAGEVIERPSSVIKELVENSVDAGAKHITIEIKNGGISYMRITDDGCGIAYDQLPTAFLRHATSKIQNGGDLVSIGTLGFRGEALASVAAVSRIEMMSRQAEDELGGRIVIEGGEQTLHEQCGCPAGTTIVIRDLFYNTPARLKFLKKDVSEGNYISAIVDKLALSNPGISFRFIRDNKSVRTSTGDGTVYSAIRAVCGRQFADTLTKSDYSYNNIEVEGYVSSPLFGRASRSMQMFFVNGRYIKSTTCMAALEEGYRNSMMTGKYPACVLNLKMPADAVDVNVHPAKTEVRFAYEKAVFDAVYLATKNALLLGADRKKEISVTREKPKDDYSPENYFARTSALNQPKPEQLTLQPEPQVVSQPEPQEKSQSDSVDIQQIYIENAKKPVAMRSSAAEQNRPSAEGRYISPEPPIEDKQPEKVEPAPTQEIPLPEEPPEFKYINPDSMQQRAKTHVIVPEQPEEEIEIRVIGEFALTYIICEAENQLVIIDKHAAHERIRFEKLKREFSQTSQLLMDEVTVKLSAEEYNALNEYYEYVEQAGVELMFMDDMTVRVTALPSIITDSSPQELVCDIAARLIQGGTEQSGALFDDILHTMACKSAIKAHDRTDMYELEALARRVYNDKTIRFCPHGRPVMTVLPKSKIEHFFLRS